MTTEEILKEMDILEEQSAKLREEIVAAKDYMTAKPMIDKLEANTNRMFELHQMNQAALLEKLFDEFKEHFGL